ncbi:hypothetical protein AB1Y20_015401 [Prymnesium parvum]|uniref:Uncharacterized protein n=1 Tax=Prymnesium parvum TaxID=97485 RepID=A0AB34JXM6_PRYPA
MAGAMKSSWTGSQAEGRPSNEGTTMHSESQKRVMIEPTLLEAPKRTDNAAEAPVPPTQSIKTEGSPQKDSVGLGKHADGTASERVRQLESENAEIRHRLAKLETLIQSQKNANFPTKVPSSKLKLSDTDREEGRNDGRLNSWTDLALGTWAGAPLCQRSIPHTAMLLTYFPLVLLYAVWAFVQYADRPQAETFSQTPTSDVPPQFIRISTECSGGWLCHQNSSVGPEGWRWDGVPTIRTVYDKESACNSSIQALPGEDEFLRFNATVPVCYSGDPSHGVLLDIPAFTLSSGCAYGAPGCRPSLRVIISDTADNSSSAMREVIDIEPFQRKSVYLGIVARSVEQTTEEFIMFGGDTTVLNSTFKLYTADLFYEGKNEDTTARFQIKMKQFAEQYIISRPGTLAEVLGEIGGFEGLILMMIACFSGVVSLAALLFRGGAVLVQGGDTPEKKHAVPTKSRVTMSEV